jgi:hypothetical protein
MSLYGSQVWDPHIESVLTAWQKCIRRVLNISPRTHCNRIPCIIKDYELMLVLERRSMGFIHSLARSDNAYLRKCLQLSVGGSRSALCNSINSEYM